MGTLWGLAIAFDVHSLDPSLSTQLITRYRISIVFGHLTAVRPTNVLQFVTAF